MNKTKILAAVGVLSVAAAASSYLTAKILVQIALDRDQPKTAKFASKKISGGRTDPCFEKACRIASENLLQKEHHIVEITGYDGTKLRGHYFPNKKAERIITAFHGWRSSWHYDFGSIFDFWYENNCGILLAEQRGQNGSGGAYMGFGLTERYDCLSWANWAACRSPLPIYLAGVSMGASSVLMSASLNLPKSVRGIIADCGFTSPKEIWKHVAEKNLHISFGLKSIFADEICKRKILMRSGDYSSEKALSQTDIPVLFIHGAADSFVPVEMTYKNYEACRSKKSLLIVPGADHAMSYYKDKPAYEKAVMNFWNNFDK